MTDLLSIENLVKRFPANRAGGKWGAKHRPQVFAVDGVSFSIERGETVGLVGESGCGKSTLARLLSRLIDPTSGVILLEGDDISGLPARRFARSPDRTRIQMVFQDPTDSLNPRFNAFDTIADPIRRLQTKTGAEVRARVLECASLCGLSDDLLNRLPHQLSGGQKARVGIARAIAVSPDLLILDEPTSALDVSVQVVILHLLRDLKERFGWSYLFVSHDLNVVRLLCNRVLVMYSGKVIESGPTASIFAAPAHPYTRMLLSSIPVLGRRGGTTTPVGEPISPIDPDPNACRFAGRCPKAQDVCSRVMPPLAPFAGGRAAACHFAVVDTRAPVSALQH